MLEFEKSPNRLGRIGRRPIYILAIATVFLSSTFAANISINQGQRIEYGQGIFQVKACDTWIGVYLKGGAVSGANQYVQTIQILGLDTAACKGTNLRFSLFKTGVSTALDMFEGATTTPGVKAAAKYLLINASSDMNLAVEDRLTLVDPTGRNIGFNDAYELIEPDYDSNNDFVGSFSVTFKYPKAQVADVNRVVLESTTA
ncbi:MAG: hypothetical protein RL414_534 [Actinomycetota bacterium]